MYFWCFGFRGELGFLNCDDVCMCVVNKQFELLEFVSESVYVVVVPYVVRAVVAMTVVHALLFVLHVCVLWECEGARVTAVLVWGPGEVWLR